MRVRAGHRDFTHQHQRMAVPGLGWAGKKTVHRFPSCDAASERAQRQTTAAQPLGMDRPRGGWPCPPIYDPAGEGATLRQPLPHTPHHRCSRPLQTTGDRRNPIQSPRVPVGADTHLSLSTTAGDRPASSQHHPPRSRRPKVIATDVCPSCHLPSSPSSPPFLLDNTRGGRDDAPPHLLPSLSISV